MDDTPLSLGTGPRPAMEVALSHLSRLIDLQLVRPGGRLPSAHQLAEEIGVSRPVVLDAIAQLKKQGRLEGTRGRGGTRVARLEPAQKAARLRWFRKEGPEILEMALLREMIEPGVARILAQDGMPAASLKRARSLAGELAQLKTTQYAVLIAIDTDFHLTLARATRRPRIIDLFVAARAKVVPTFDILPWAEDRRSRSDDQHARLLDAIEARDPQTAADVAYEHVRVSTRLIGELLRRGR
jgi:DNA-binding FadR family transcriptional regulator